MRRARQPGAGRGGRGGPEGVAICGRAGQWAGRAEGEAGGAERAEGRAARRSGVR